MSFLQVFVIASPTTIRAEGSPSAPSPDAGAAFQLDASSPAETGLDAEAIGTLRVRLQRLRKLERNAADLQVPLTSLFAVDVRDEAAVALRIQRIDARRAEFERQVPHLSTISTSSTSTSTVPPRELWTALEAEALAIERGFLSLSPAQRRALIHADQARWILIKEAEAAATNAAEAEAEARDAEAARLKALEEAQHARSELIKSIKSKLASVARKKVELAERDRVLAQRRKEHSERHADATERVQTLVERSATETDATKLASLFGEIRNELKLALDALNASVIALDTDVDINEIFAPDAARAEDAPPDVKAVTRELDAAVKEFGEYAEDVRNRAYAFRILAVQASAKRAQALAAARLKVLSKLPATSQAKLRGISPEGLGEASLEARLLALGLKSQPVLQADRIRHAPELFRDVFALGRTFWQLVKLALIIGLALWLRRRGDTLGRWYQSNIRPHFRSAGALRRANFGVWAIEQFGPYLLFLGTLHAVSWALDDWRRIVEVDLILTTVFWISYYFLVRAALDFAIGAMARQRHVPISPEIQREVHRSTTLVARTVLVAGLLHSVAVRILGDGVLFAFAQAILLIAIFVVLFIIVRRWRTTIASAYLAQWPEGRLAELVESTRDRWINLPVVALALAYVVTRGIAVFAKQFVLGFEQTRKALAFLFRLRLERRSAKKRWVSEIDKLPEAVRKAFSWAPLEDAAYRVEHFPGLDELKEDVLRWKKGTQKGSFLLTGSRGYGKTTWLNRAKSELSGLPHMHVFVERTGHQTQSVVDLLTQSLGLVADDPDDVVTALREGPEQVVMLDGIHLLFARRMGGCEAIDTLMKIIEATGQRVFWICAADALTWRHIVAARPSRVRFRAEQRLSDWPEDKLRELLTRRASASGVTYEFEELVVSGDADSTQEALTEASEAYARLIWDYSDGCPLVALRFWLHSLQAVDDTTVRVRLFVAPDDSRLEQLPAEGIFVYAAVANHGRLNVVEVADILGFSPLICETNLVRGVEDGFLAVSADARYGVSVDWQRHLIRFLRARQAL